MKKISQAIIAATLILDVAVIFTFGLAVVSSFEDGSRLPETTFVRRPIEGRVAGETTSSCPTTANVAINPPFEGASITDEIFRITAMTSAGTMVPASTLMHFVYPITVSPFIRKIPVTYQTIGENTTLLYGWVADINISTQQIQNGLFTFHAEGYDAMGNCIARSDNRSININFTSSNALLIPSVNITSPQSGGILSGVQATVIGEIINLSSGAQIQEAKLMILNNTTQAAGPFNASAPDPTNPLLRQGVFDSTTTATPNGAYDVKMFIHYLSSDGILKFIESSRVSISINNSGTTNTTANTNTAISSSNSNTSAPGTGSNSTNTSSTTDNSSTGTSGSTGTSSGGTSTTSSIAITITKPDPLNLILRSRDNPLAAKTSAAVSGLRFIVHKSDESADWTTPIDAVSSDKINWKANMNLMVFKDGAYDIKAVSGDIKSAPVNVIVQKIAFNWINPIPSQTPPVLSGNAPIKVKIGGIYEKDGITPVKGVKVYSYQTNTQAPYTEYYNEQLYQNSGTQEWRLYDWALKKEKSWKTLDSSNGKFHLFVKVINESINATDIWFPTEKILIEIKNQQVVLPFNNANISALGANNNQNLNATAANTAVTNTAASNSPDTAAAQNANTAINANTDAAQNVNAASDSMVAAVLSDSDQDLLNDEDERVRGTDPNSADTDNDGLTDFVEVDKYKTDPLKNDTDGDGYMDGEEVQSLHDPLKPPTDPTAAVLVKPKPVEEPRNSKQACIGYFKGRKNASNRILMSQGQLKKIQLSKGKGPANTILTLFIYSNDPIVVTVRTNENGEWIYELDKTLEDGEHEVYATITDDTGKIESTSSPMRFLVKQARAETIPERADTAVKDVSAKLYKCLHINLRHNGIDCDNCRFCDSA